jgi:hypothetical protein
MDEALPLAGSKPAPDSVRSKKKAFSVSTQRYLPIAEVKQGQTAIGLDATNAAVTGIVAKTDATGIYASLPNMMNGSAIVNLSGELIGISGGGDLYLPADRIDALLTAP